MANKKISQLVAKTAILSTDLFPIGDATTGTLYKKTIAELQAAIGGAVISVNGLVGVVVLDADDILETATPTNRYFTEARARAAISLTTSGSSGASTYSSSTGVLNVPTYTLAGLGGITASFLSGGTGITYNSTTGVISYSGTVYTDSSVRALFSGGTGITYNSSTGAISYSGTVYTDASIRGLFSAGTGLSYNSSTGAFSSTITQYTDALARAAISLTTTGTSGASTYNSTTGVLNIPQYQAVLTNPVTGTGTSGYVTFWNGSGTVTGDAALFWDNTNKRLGVGATSPSYRLHVTGTSGVGARTIQADGTGTAFNIVSVVNDGSQMFLATEGVTAGTIATGSLAYAGVVDMNTNTALQFATFATVRMTITNGGNVGIGTTSPSAFLHIKGGNNNSLWIDNGGTQYTSTYIANNGTVKAFVVWDNTNAAYQIGTAVSSSVQFIVNNAEAMRITAGGNVGIGTSSPGALLHLYKSGTSGGSMIIQTVSGNDANLRILDQTREFYIGTSGGNYYVYDANAALNRYIITAGGNHLIGTTTDNGERLYVSGSIRATGTITANSDITLKKNLAKIENALEKVEQINGYTYEFKEDDSKRHAGVIAQEIQEVLPEIVNKGNDGLLGVEYGNISALLIEAIKDLKLQNESLVERLEALEK